MIAGLVKLAAIGFRRYTTEPEGRCNASRLMLVAAVHLYALHTSRQEAAKVALHALTSTDEDLAA